MIRKTSAAYFAPMAYPAATGEQPWRKIDHIPKRPPAKARPPAQRRKHDRIAPAAPAPDARKLRRQRERAFDIKRRPGAASVAPAPPAKRWAAPSTQPDAIAPRPNVGCNAALTRGRGIDQLTQRQSSSSRSGFPGIIPRNFGIGASTPFT